MRPSIDQIREDIAACEKIGAEEVILEVDFTLGGQSLINWQELLEEFPPVGLPVALRRQTHNRLSRAINFPRSRTELERPWLLDFITCAAPYATAIGQPQAGDLLNRSIHSVLAIAHGYGYSALVLGAWGCGAFANDPRRTAVDFRHALEHEYDGAFSEVVFAIADWSPERRFLGPFRYVFAADSSP